MERVFIGIFPGNKILEQIEKIRSESAPFLTGRFIEPSNIHTTIQFIGFVSKEKVNEIAGNIRKTSINLKPFSLEYKSLGCFPSFSSPRVLWIGMEDESRVLSKLKQELDDLNKEFIKIERKSFTPHLTIAKIKDIKDYNAFASLMNTYKNTSFGKDVIESIYLLESRLKRSGAEYFVIEKFNLGI